MAGPVTLLQREDGKVTDLPALTLSSGTPVSVLATVGEPPPLGSPFLVTQFAPLDRKLKFPQDGCRPLSMWVSVPSAGLSAAGGQGPRAALIGAFESLYTKVCDRRLWMVLKLLELCSTVGGSAVVSVGFKVHTQ